MIVEWRPQLRALLLSEKEETRLKAGRTLEELSGNIGKGSAVNVVNQNFNPVTVVEDDDDTFMERVNRTLRKRVEPDDGEANSG